MESWVKKLEVAQGGHPFKLGKIRTEAGQGEAEGLTFSQIGYADQEADKLPDDGGVCGALDAQTQGKDGHRVAVIFKTAPTSMAPMA